MQGSRYERRGVSSSKGEVHAAIAGLDPGVVPGAFVKIVPDLSGDPAYGLALHADGAGTKAIVAYLWWRETGDASAFRGIAQDAVVMNVDDLLCAGIAGDAALSSTIARNKRLIPGEVIREIIDGTEAFCARLRSLGFDIRTAGGETEDVGDLVRTVSVNATVAARIRRDLVIDPSRIRPGDVIVGFSSTGRAAYEDDENAGIGSNGLTSARHDLLCRDYAERYPETLDPGVPRDLAYAGPFRLADAVPGTALPLGRAILSPTRTYAPVVRDLLAGDRASIHGLIHCTGGGQTKCIRFGDGIHYIKDHLFPEPPLFRLIRETTGTGVREMHEVFNMGHRVEAMVPAEAADDALRIAARHGIEARVVGRCEASGGPNRLTIIAAGETLSWP
ncbi:MAG: phosphoribosylformylglycinamidine cyclo-ligase [Planctomycetes bacterium]|nr:phosphoribosylformylglycinamidine cyclo-ligase [Planctomycetota bacterium]